VDPELFKNFWIIIQLIFYFDYRYFAGSWTWGMYEAKFCPIRNKFFVLKNIFKSWKVSKITLWEMGISS
jgi:hypothetical protein